MSKKTIYDQTPDVFVGEPAGQPRQLPSGYVGQNVPTDFSIPPCGIEDVDRALTNLFEKSLGLQVENGGIAQNVPTIFATGERFALIHRRRPIRDKSGALILPLVSIRRTSLEQKLWSLPRNLGDLVIKKRLSASDHTYQALLNKTKLLNQNNVATRGNFIDTVAEQGVLPGRLATRRSGQVHSNVRGTIDSNVNQNIFEFLTIPFPKFFIATYEIVFWAQYTQHMNQLLEKFMSSYHAQGFQFKISTEKGYWFVGYVEDQMTPQDNLNDFAENERIIKYMITMTVPAYIVAPRNPGDMVPFRKYVSAPQVSFGFMDVGAQTFIRAPPVGLGNINKFVLSDVNTLDKDGEQTISTRTSIPYKIEKIRDPFSNTDAYRHVRISSRNERVGETVGRLDLETTFDDI